MKLLHLSDLHLGKRVNEFPMLEDQKYILAKILHVIDEEKPDAVIIAGDVYDKSIPGEDAVKVFDDFLCRIAKRKIETFIISGNHDSAVKLAFASKLIDLSGIHLSPVYHGEIEPYTLKKGEEKINIYMLPFIKPVVVRAQFPEEAEQISNYTDACRVAIAHMEVNEAESNVLIAHQFVAGAVTSDSEESSVGGLDQVDYSVFSAFDYVALGHIHGSQRVGRDTVRYCGTPLKYSLSEVNHKKSITIVEIEHKEVEIRTVDLKPLHEMREIQGTFEELVSRKNYQGTATDDYIHAILTDEEEILDAMGKLRVIYPNIMKISYHNKRTQENRILQDNVDVENKSPLELFEDFFETQNNQKMNEEQREFVSGLIEKIWKENEA